jgi:hypothetical protein
VPAPRNRKHILVQTRPTTERYRPHPRKIPPPPGPPAPASRSKHAKTLERALKTAVTEAGRRRNEAGIEVHGAEPGLYVQFESQPGIPLELGSFEAANQGIELVAVSHALTEEKEPRRVERATVFVPDGKVGHFLRRLEAYAKTAPKKEGELRHEKMLDPVATLRLATLRSLWTDASEAYPDDENTEIWWEVWLRRQDADGSELARLMEFAAHQELEVAPRRLQFEDRTVTLVRAAPTQLAASIDVLNDVAEVRKAKQAATVFIDMGPDEQGDWTKELLDRTRVAPGFRCRPRRARHRRGLPGQRLVEGSAEARPQRQGREVRARHLHRDARRRNRHLDAGRRGSGRASRARVVALDAGAVRARRCAERFSQRVREQPFFTEAFGFI